MFLQILFFNIFIQINFFFFCKIPVRSNFELRTFELLVYTNTISYIVYNIYNIWSTYIYKVGIWVDFIPYSILNFQFSQIIEHKLTMIFMFERFDENHFSLQNYLTLFAWLFISLIFYLIISIKSNLVVCRLMDLPMKLLTFSLTSLKFF